MLCFCFDSMKAFEKLALFFYLIHGIWFGQGPNQIHGIRVYLISQFCTFVSLMQHSTLDIYHTYTDTHTHTHLNHQYETKSIHSNAKNCTYSTCLCCCWRKVYGSMHTSKTHYGRKFHLQLCVCVKVDVACFVWWLQLQHKKKCSKLLIFVELFTVYLIE